MNPAETKKELAQFISIHEKMKNLADKLLSRVRNIKKSCRKKDFEKALNLLHSRFWTYRYLRQLINLYKDLDESWKKLSQQQKTFNENDLHRFLWYDEEVSDLAKDEEKMRLFGSDVLKELSRNQDIEEHLRSLKEKYNPAVEAGLNGALEKIEQELINLDSFAKKTTAILRTKEKMVGERVQKVTAQVNLLERELRNDMEREIRQILLTYDSSPESHRLGKIDWKRSELKSRMLTPSQLYFPVNVVFKVGASVQGRFAVYPSSSEPGRYRVSFFPFTEKAGKENKYTADDFERVKLLAKEFIADLKKALQGR